MKYFRRGRHRANKHSVTVADLQWQLSRITVDKLFDAVNALWDQRGEIQRREVHA